MYRVELKDVILYYLIVVVQLVPNVPCGVERYILLAHNFDRIEVPNVPCGVESLNFEDNPPPPIGS